MFTALVYFCGYDLNLIIDIKNGRREKIINGTPIKYSDLYEGKYFLNIL